MPNHRSIKLLNWNGRSVLRKQLEFFDFLQRHEVDIAAVSETWLRTANSFHHPNYVCLRADRQTEDAARGGGVMLSIKRGIKYEQIDFTTKVIEAIGIKVDCSGTRIKIISVYFPGARHRGDWHHFRNDLRKLTEGDIPTFVVGDLNARSRQWNCSKGNKAGSQLLQVLAAENFFIHAPDSHTFYPTGRGRASTLDIILSNNLVNMTKPAVVNELSSDHLPVLFTVDTNPSEIATDNTKYCYARANWRRFQRVINERIDLNNPNLDINDVASIDSAIDFFKNSILHAETCSVPKLPSRPYEVPDIPENTRQLIRLRNRRRRQWIRSKDPFYKVIVEALNNRIREECAQSRFRKFGEVIANMHPGEDKMWKISRALRKNCKYTPPLRSDGQLVASPQRKADLLAENFAAAHNNTADSDPDTSRVVEESIRQIHDSPSEPDTNYLVRPKQVQEMIKKIKNKKSPGCDKICNQLLKHLPRKAIILLARIFTACLKHCYFPCGWKHAIIVPIPKPGKDITNPSNYRPISLLSSLSKLLERAILSRLEQHLETAHVIPDEQFGFKHGHSTNHQLVRLISHIKSGFHNKQSSGMILLDVEKAYDSVWHDAILHKMLSAGFPVRLIKIVESFIKNRSFQVIVNGVSSGRKNIPYGVPQGSVLSPTLYNIFTADVVMVDGAEYYIFADDTAFIATDRDPEIVVTKLQAAQSALEEYQRKWKMKINPAKTQAIYFSNRRSPRYLPQRCVIAGGHEVEWSTEVKYLGLNLDQKLKFASHVQKSLQKCDKLVKSLYSLICRRSRLNKTSKLLLYKAIIRPTITYGFPAWSSCARTHRKKLQIKQNRLLKMMLNLDPYHPTNDLHQVAGINTIDEFIFKLLPKFWDSCNMSENPLLQTIPRPL